VSGTVAAPKATPIPTPTPQPVATPTPAPTPQPTIAPTPEPTPEATPTPGVTAGAQPVVKPYPDIPDELKSDDYSSYVRVLVSISAAGDTKKVTLVTSSGTVDIDQRVISAMMQWKWKPALENGKPVDSVEHYRFNFEVN
jgi:TonB family protein